MLQHYFGGSCFEILLMSSDHLLPFYALFSQNPIQNVALRIEKMFQKTWSPP